MEYTYKLYLKDDTSIEQLNLSRKDFNYEGQDMYYLIDETGNISVVQSENTRPYKNCTLEECAQRQIADMKAEAEKAAKEAAAKDEQQAKIDAQQAELDALKAQMAAFLAAQNNTTTA